MERTERFDVYVVEKDRQYVKSQPLYKMLKPGWQPDYNPHVWDAKMFPTRNLAEKIAVKVDGRVRYFDKLEGRLR